MEDFSQMHSWGKKETFEQRSYWLTAQGRSVREISEYQIAQAWSKSGGVEVFITFPQSSGFFSVVFFLCFL